MRSFGRVLSASLAVFLLLAFQLHADEPPAAARVEESKPGAKKLLIGEAEFVEVSVIDEVFRARIDTGATTSSIYAVNVEEFERDGKSWVRFVVKNSETKKEYPLERPVARIAKIKKRGEEGFTRRFAVATDLTLGGVTKQVSINLADRTGFEFPLLIGRDFLSGLAIVDVSKKYTQTSPGAEKAEGKGNN